jgi:hypothetical protein
VTAVWVRALAELRVRRSGALAIAVLIGLLSGVVMASAAGPDERTPPIPGSWPPTRPVMASSSPVFQGRT